MEEEDEEGGRGDDRVKKVLVGRTLKKRYRENIERIMWRKKTRRDEKEVIGIEMY